MKTACYLRLQSELFYSVKAVISGIT